MGTVYFKDMFNHTGSQASVLKKLARGEAAEVKGERLRKTKTSRSVWSLRSSVSRGRVKFQHGLYFPII